MSMVCGLDLHRGQITFDAVEEESGEVWRGRLWRPDRHRFRRWLRHDVVARAGEGPVRIAVEGCTGWRYVVEEIQAAGFEAQVAEPAETKAMRGRKKRAKTDRTDARLLRDLLQAGELPVSWIPPTVVLEWRERTRLYKSLIDQRSVWVQRIHAELYQHGVALPEERIRTDATRRLLLSRGVDLSEAARQRIEVAYRMIDAVCGEADVVRDQINNFGRSQPACRALIDAIYGFGPMAGVVVWSELGDCRRFTRSRQVVRHTGLRDRGCLRHPPPGRLPLEAGPGHAALGTVRSRAVRSPSHQPRPRLLPVGQTTPRRQARRHLRSPQVGPPQLPHPPANGTRGGVRHTRAHLKPASHTHLSVSATGPAHLEHQGLRGRLLP